MIIHKLKLIFVHIPKTGGSTISNILVPNINIHDEKYMEYLYGIKNNKALQHLSIIEIKKIVKNTDDYYKFSIVRNPYDRLVSEYYWCQIKNIGNKSGQKFDDFLNYIIDIFKNNKFDTNIYTDHFIPQYKFLYDDNILKVDKIFKFENFNNVLQFLKEKYDINTNFYKHLKVHNGNKLNLTQNQKNIIYNLYKKDFELFNYPK